MGRGMVMTPELQKYYENRLSMMGEVAWGELMADVELMLSTTNNLDGVSDDKVLHFRRGEISIMRWMLSLRDTSERAYEELKNETNS
jgi:hypothetical protein